MAIVIAALLPVFLLIVLGLVLKRSLMRLETQWHGLERLTYYVLFPAKQSIEPRRHCERSEAIHLAAQRKNGLLRCAKKKQTDKLLILLNVMDEPPPSVLFHPRGSAKGRCGTRNDEESTYDFDLAAPCARAVEKSSA